ncbi:hypothetical protein [Psychrobacillus sp. NPDC093180]|uniref:hypothetical protein n=1 Tax=Psychrobacillus sp. NPDC093180 TaxID=3364489 RepID=UPI0037F22D71
MKKILFMIPLFLLFACSNTEKYEHVNVYVVETWGENAGYKKVNDLTNVEEGKNYITVNTRSIEDFYDKDGNNKRTEIISSDYTSSNITNVGQGEDLKEVLPKPSTILISEDKNEPFKLDDMTEEEKERVKKHILSYTNNLSKK